MSIDWSSIPNIFISPYFSFLMLVCGLLQYVIYLLEEGGKFPVERNIAKWCGLTYLSVGVISYFVSLFI
jgi:hypothetical protein